MADESEDFSTLNDMVTEAQQYGAQASFGKPSLDADSLSNIITSLASSLTTSKTKTEMTELNTGKAKLVRMDIEREKLNTPDYVGDWKFYESNNREIRHVNKFWIWSDRQTNGFVDVVDTRCYVCFDENASNECPTCGASFLCTSCYIKNNGFAWHMTRYNNHQSDCQRNLSFIRMKSLVHKDLPSWSIAVKDQIFGEGAERIVRKGK